MIHLAIATASLWLARAAEAALRQIAEELFPQAKLTPRPNWREVEARALAARGDFRAMGGSNGRPVG